MRWCEINDNDFKYSVKQINELNVPKKWQMRSYTEDEIEAHEEMLERLSIDTGINICEKKDE